MGKKAFHYTNIRVQSFLQNYTLAHKCLQALTLTLALCSLVDAPPCLASGGP